MAKAFARRFARHNVNLTVCANGAEALLQVGLIQPEVLVVSSSLPVVDGATVARVLRRQRATPVVMGVAPGDAGAVSAALDIGAVNFVRRPYDFEDLLRVLRTARPREESTEDHLVLECGPIRLDDEAHEVHVSGRPVVLPLREYNLLRYLMRNVNRVVSSAEIRERVWGYPGDINTVSVHVRRLRVRLGDTSRQHALIHTIRGVGYQLQAANPG